MIAVLEQQEAKGRLRIDMALARGPLQPSLGLCEIERYAATEPVGLAEVERGVGVALFRQRPPDRDGAGGIAFLPGIDSRTNRLRVGGQRRDSANHQAKQQLTHFQYPDRWLA